MVKRPRGSAALAPPCWSSAIWPVFEDQSCNFLFSSVLHGFGRLCQMNATEATFRMVLSSPFMLHFFIIKWELCSVFLYFSYITLALLIPFISLFSSPLCSCCWFPQIALHLIASSFSPPPPAFFRSPSVVLICVITCFLPTAHPLPCKWEWRERVGRARCRTRRTGFNEAALNEFTACHWTAPSRVAGLAPRPLCQKAPSLCSPTCLSDTSCN